MNKSILDSGIPLLTEVIKPVTGDHAPEPAAASVSERMLDRIPDRVPDKTFERPAEHLTPAPPPFLSRPLQNDAPEPVAAKPAALWTDAASTRLEQQISERVLQQMMGKIDHVLEQRVRDSLADVLQVAVEGLTTEIRTGLQEMLHDVISRAVTQEIARLQANRK